jgi:hypothetical protein
MGKVQGPCLELLRAGAERVAIAGGEKSYMGALLRRAGLAATFTGPYPDNRHCVRVIPAVYAITIATYSLPL